MPEKCYATTVWEKPDMYKQKDDFSSPPPAMLYRSSEWQKQNKK